MITHICLNYIKHTTNEITNVSLKLSNYHDNIDNKSLSIIWNYSGYNSMFSLLNYLKYTMYYRSNGMSLSTVKRKCHTILISQSILIGQSILINHTSWQDHADYKILSSIQINLKDSTNQIVNLTPIVKLSHFTEIVKLSS